MARRRIPLDTDAVIEAYTGGQSIPSIAEALDRHNNSIRWVIVQAGIPLRDDRGRGTRTPAACGTNPGYYRHLRTTGDPACDACLAAHAKVEKARRAVRGPQPRRKRIAPAKPAAPVVVIDITTPLTTPQWMNYAACNRPGINPDWFFPDATAPASMAAQARAICRACPVAIQCRTYALENREKHGIWGGKGMRNAS